MSDVPYTITLSDGRTINRIRMNSTTFVSEIPVEDDVFSGYFPSVEVTGEGVTRVYRNVEFKRIGSPNDEEYWFAISERPDIEVQIEKLNARVDYIAMMAGIDVTE